MIKVLVVDDNAIVLMGLCEALAMDPELEAVGTAATSEQAIQIFRDTLPDVVTMDYQLPDKDGVECAREIMQEFPDAKIILLSAFSAEEDVWNAVRAGAKGYLSKAAGEAEEIIDAIHEVASGGSFFPAEIMIKLEHRNGIRDLTNRELKVLKLVAGGKMNKEISEKLSLSEPAIKQHLVSIRKKLDAPDRTSAVVNAYKLGILKLNE